MSRRHQRASLPPMAGAALVVQLFSTVVGGCLPAVEEPGASGGLTGEISIAKEVVGLYTTEAVQTNKGRLSIVSRWGTGVRLCPNVVLTVTHNMQPGTTTLWAAGERQIGRITDLVITDSQTHERRRQLVRVVDGTDAVYATMVYERELSYQVNADGVLHDGLAILQLSSSAGSDIRYPALASRSGWNWRFNEEVQMVGYGYGTAGRGPMWGARLHGPAFFLAFVDHLGTITGEGQPFLSLKGSAEYGDSGGPLFRNGELAGITFAAAGRTNLAYDIGANRDWIMRGRDALCPRRSSWTLPAEEPASAVQMPLAPVAQATGDPVPQNAELDLELSDTEEVCVCDGPCEDSCPDPDESTAPPDQDDRLPSTCPDEVPWAWTCGADAYCDGRCDCGCGADDALGDCADVACERCWESGQPIGCEAEEAPACSCSSDCGCRGDCCDDCWVACGSEECSCADDGWCEESWSPDYQELSPCECDFDC